MKLAVFASLLMIIPFQTVAGSCIGEDVEVWVEKGKGLTGDGLLRPDPYVVITIGGTTHKSKVIHSNRNPSWFERIDFPDATNDMMKIDVWDKDRITADDHLGTCMEPLNSGGHTFHHIQCNLNKGFVKLFYKCHGL